MTDLNATTRTLTRLIDAHLLRHTDAAKVNDAHPTPRHEALAWIAEHALNHIATLNNELNALAAGNSELTRDNQRIRAQLDQIRALALKHNITQGNCVM